MNKESSRRKRKGERSRSPSPCSGDCQGDPNNGGAVHEEKPSRKLQKVMGYAQFKKEGTRMLERGKLYRIAVAAAIRALSRSFAGNKDSHASKRV